MASRTDERRNTVAIVGQAMFASLNTDRTQGRKQP
jgi:hypothetical protein